MRGSSTVEVDLDSSDESCADADTIRILARHDGRAPESATEPGTFVLHQAAPGENKPFDIEGLRAAAIHRWRLQACKGDTCAVAPFARSQQTETEAEVWYLPTIRSISADGERVIEQNRIGCVDVFQYPEGFDLEGHMGIIYIETGKPRDEMKLVYSLEPGWQTWNGAEFTEPVTIAINSLYGSPWGELSCPWVVPTTDGDNNWLRMYIEIVSTDEGGQAAQTGMIDSVDDIGLDWGIECTDEDGCELCEFEELCDYSDTSGDGSAGILIFDLANYEGVIDGFGHGRFMRNEYDLTTWNPDEDELTFLITLDTQSTCTVGEIGLNDTYRASRDPSTGLWTFDEGEDGCPGAAIVDHHDPSIIHQGTEGFFKGYTIDSTWTGMYVNYSEDGGETWENESLTEIYMVDENDEPDFDAPFDVRCMEDQDHILWNDEGTRREGVVFSARSHDVELGCWPIERNGFVAGVLWN